MQPFGNAVCWEPGGSGFFVRRLLAHTHAAIAALVGTKSDASGTEFPRLHDAWPACGFCTDVPRR